ncbi:MAG: aminopeptidase [Gemmatimonadetes bacterium]|nr:aminopeptidase [Gemmatimonadota bacterium]
MFSTIALALGFSAMIPLISPDSRFLARSAYEEARILLQRQSIQELVADSSTDAVLRRQLHLVVRARNFAHETLGLDVGETYTMFSDVRRDTLLLVLTASPKTELRTYTWRFPIVGRLPYKGFFSVREARAEVERLERDGYDTYLRPSGAFSTLGWFDDPLLSTALSNDPLTLVSTVLHEVTHSTLYLPGEANFNESFASFVGFLGAHAFFREAGDARNAGRALAIWRDEIRLQNLYTSLRRELEFLYSQSLDDSVVSARREEVFDAARDNLRSGVGGELEVYDGERLADRPLNNASVLASGIYRSQLDLFEELLRLEDGSLRAVVETILELTATADGTGPYSLVQSYLEVAKQL